MLITQTMERLRELKLTGMARALEEQTSSAEYDDMGFEERLGLLVDREAIERGNRRLKTRLRKAKLRQQACMEDIDYRHSRGLDRSVMRTLSTCQWIRDRHNLIITGPTGAGKSYISCALAHRACIEGYTAMYSRAPRLFGELAVARGDGRYAKLMKTIARTNLLIIDDWGLSVLTEPERKDLLEILEDRHGVHSTIVAGQLPVEHWHEAIGNPTLADAILDRLVHNAYKIDLKGESMRKKKNNLDSVTNKG